MQGNFVSDIQSLHHKRECHCDVKVLLTRVLCITLHTLFGDDINPLGHCWLVLVMSLSQQEILTCRSSSSQMGHLETCHAMLCMMWQGCL